MEIPIQNIYFLLCYAWNNLDEGKVVDIKSIDSTKLVDLFAKILINGITHLLKRGIDRNYILVSEEINAIKGKLVIGFSYRRQLLQKGKAVCSYDELHHNILHNQILKTTLYKLVHVKELNGDLKKELISIYHYFQHIEQTNLSANSFSKVVLNRNNYFYSFLLNVCQLIYENLLVSEDTGESKFRDFLRDAKKIAYLFDQYVSNFNRMEQNTFRVSREDINWHVSEASRKFFPKMQTDISLVSSKRKIIVDTKYYSSTFHTYYDSEKIHSNNLNQMYTYLKQVEYKDELSKTSEGIILYPKVDNDVFISEIIENHKITIATINLNQDWQLIHKSLLDLIKCDEY